MSSGSIAVVGASSDRKKYGNKCVRAYREAGWEVFPVNLRATEIEGLKVYRHLDDLPSLPDRVSIYLPPAKTGALLPELARQRDAEIWFNPGSATLETVSAARRAGLDTHHGCSIVDIGYSPAQFP